MKKENSSAESSSLPPGLEALRKELEGISTQKIKVIKRVSARARVQSIRNSHIAACGAIFFKKSRSGSIVFNPKAGKRLIEKIFTPDPDELTIPYGRTK